MKNKISGIKIFKSDIYKDNRGFFKEVYKKNIIKNNELIFHCTSSSKKNVLRGLHTQIKNPQAKFLTVLKGKIFDVVLDLRKKSKTFGSSSSLIQFTPITPIALGCSLTYLITSSFDLTANTFAGRELFFVKFCK